MASFRALARKLEVAITWLEGAACSAGDGFPVATLATRAGPIAVGAMICFDREHPESAKLLGLGGAELILVPNACALGDFDLDRLRAFRVAEAGLAATRRPDLYRAISEKRDQV